MTNFELPTRNDLPAFSYLIDLEGGQFTLSFNFNERMNRWLMNIQTNAGENILMGIPLVADRPLTDRFTNPRLPQGQFIAFDTSGNSVDPGRFDLGERVVMVYRI